jgi:hypothetical protein
VGVDFKLTPAQEAFREEIRGFLRSERVAEPRRVHVAGAGRAAPALALLAARRSAMRRVQRIS